MCIRSAKCPPCLRAWVDCFLSVCAPALVELETPFSTKCNSINIEPQHSDFVRILEHTLLAPMVQHLRVPALGTSSTQALDHEAPQAQLNSCETHPWDRDCTFLRIALPMSLKRGSLGIIGLGLARCHCAPAPPVDSSGLEEIVRNGILTQDMEFDALESIASQVMARFASGATTESSGACR